MTTLFVNNVTTTDGIFSANFLTGAGTVNGDILTYDPNGTYPITVQVTYTVGDINFTAGGCYDQNTVILTILETPSPSFDLLDAICLDDPSVNSIFDTYITGGNLINGEFTVNGVPQGVNVDIFMNDILALGVGIHEIIYTETITTTAGTCEAIISETIEVYQAGDAGFTTASGDFFYCEGENAETLIPNIAGGVFSGTGVIEIASGVYAFDPTGLSGTYSITYTIADGPCTSSETNTITVYETVDASLEPLTLTACSNETGQFDLTLSLIHI